MTNSNCDIKFRPSILQYVSEEIPSLFIFLILVIIPGLKLPFDTAALSKGALVIACVMFLLLLVKYAVIRSIHYVISSEQLIYCHGVLGTTQEYMELYRVIDFRETRTFMQRLFGVKTVTVVSGDRSTPQLDIKGVPADFEIVSELRSRVEINKKRRGIHEITNI